MRYSHLLATVEPMRNEIKELEVNAEAKQKQSQELQEKVQALEGTIFAFFYFFTNVLGPSINYMIKEGCIPSRWKLFGCSQFLWSHNLWVLLGAINDNFTI